ncbi:MAG: hypothetical protein HY848_09070 [Betaproteobacteria bacterium]|nr:hypothetical protein [Betaproteobacteria bacterium]
MKPSEALAAHRDKLLAIVAGHGASNLRLFGSVAKGPTRRAATATRSRACTGHRRCSARTVARYSSNSASARIRLKACSAAAP